VHDAQSSLRKTKLGQARALPYGLPQNRARIRAFPEVALIEVDWSCAPLYPWPFLPEEKGNLIRWGAARFAQSSLRKTKLGQARALPKWRPKVRARSRSCVWSCAPLYPWPFLPEGKGNLIRWGAARVAQSSLRKTKLGQARALPYGLPQNRAWSGKRTPEWDTHHSKCRGHAWAKGRTREPRRRGRRAGGASVRAPSSVTTTPWWRPLV